MKKLLILLVGIALVGSSAHADEGAVYRATVAADGVQHVEIEGGDYFFRPSRVVVRADVPVILSVKVESGIVPHSIAIDAPEAGIAFDEKLSTQARTIRFTPTAVGNYPFYCANRLLFFESHREKGMVGVLEVVD